MFTLLKDWIVNAALWDATLIVLALAILLFFILSILLAVYTVALRFVNIRRRRRWVELESRWENKLLDILSSPGDAESAKEQLHRLVGKKERLYFVDFLQRYARLLKGQEVEVLKDLAKPYLGGIQKHLLAKDAERRARAVRTLSVLGLEEYVDDIVRALDDPSPLTAMTAARSLANKEHPEYIQPVLKTLHRFENWSNAYLTSMLVSVGPDIIPNLHETLSDPEAPVEVRAVVCDALKDLNDFSSADVACSILKQDVNRELTASCLRLVARMGRPDQLPIIRTFIESSDDAIRIQAIRALGSLAEPEDYNSLENAIVDASPWVALQAARGLRESGGLNELRAIAESDHERAVLAKQVLEEDE